MRVTIQQRTLRFRTPLQTSYGAVAEREIYELEIEGADGIAGRGEAAPLEDYDGVSAERARAALEAYRAVLCDGDELHGGELLEACRAADDLPQALAAVDMALWDRAGHRAGRPVARLLTDDVLDEVASTRRSARRIAPAPRRAPTPPGAPAFAA